MSYKRLDYIVSEITETDNVLDIGTDHGFVPIFLLKKYPNINVSASDINENPLEIARENLKKNKMLSKVELYISDGVENIDIKKFDTFVIAGMGGNEISKIISQKNLKGKLILHATINHEHLRKTLSRKGYKIIKESIIKERKTLNVIITAIPGYKYLSSKDKYLGPLLRKSKDASVNEYFTNLLNHNTDLYEKTNKNKFKKNIKYLRNI